jgi:hypothetical protein
MLNGNNTTDIVFGAYNWSVLDMQGNHALIITNEIVEQSVYHKDRNPITWAECDLQKYLNGEFYNKFSKEQQKRILEVTNKNLPNQWIKTEGGKETRDKIFLLSMEEVVRYFGDSGQLKNKNPNSKYWINDQYNNNRQPKFNKSRNWWWLRSPGIRSNVAVFVNIGGSICLSGHYVNNGGGGVRPALWLNLES